MLDAAAQTHDYYYNLANTGGISGALFSHGTADADEQLANAAQQVISFYFNKIQDPVSHNQVSFSEYHWTLLVVLLFYQTAGWKSLDK